MFAPCMFMLTACGGENDNGGGGNPQITCAHVWSDWTIDDQPTCSKEGKKTRTCELCQTKDYKSISKLAHNFGEPQTTPSTCKSAGKIVKTCLSCGFEEIDDLPLSTEHSFGEEYRSDLFSHYHECSVCGLRKDEELHEYCDYSTENENKGKCRVCLASGATTGLTYYTNSDGYYVYSLGTVSGEIENLIFPSYYNDKPVTTIDYNIADSIKNNLNYAKVKKVMLPNELTELWCNAFDLFEDSVFEIEDNVKYVGKWAISVAQNSVCSIKLRDDTVGIAAGFSIRKVNEKWTNVVSGEITIPKSVKYVCTKAIGGSLITKLIINTEDADLTSGFINEPLYELTGLKSIEVSSDNSRYFVENNCLVDKNTGDVFLAAVNAILPTSPEAKKVSCKIYTNATTFTIPGNIKKFGEAGCGVLNESDVEHIVISDGVEEISSYSLYRNHKLKSVSFPTSLIKIGSAAFKECENLESVTIPNSITELESSVFSGCKKLSSVTFPENLKKIGDQVFDECESLTSVQIPDSVTTLGGGIFNDCTKLTNIIFSNNSKYTFVSGCIIEKDTKTLVVACYNAVIPTSSSVVTELASKCFYRYKGTDLVVPDNITFINKEALYWSQFESISLPYGNGWGIAKLFGEYSDAPSTLKTIIIRGGTTIGSYAFEGCSNVTTIKLLSNTLQYIKSDAFKGCTGLTNLEISRSSNWKSVGKDRFGNTTYTSVNLTIETLCNGGEFERR